MIPLLLSIYVRVRGSPSVVGKVRMPTIYRANKHLEICVPTPNHLELEGSLPNQGLVPGQQKEGHMPFK